MKKIKYGRRAGNRSASAAPKLGDMLEEFLSGVGITKEGYRRAKEVFGMPPTCNCEKRKKWLNDVSDWWRKKKSKKISK